MRIDGFVREGFGRVVLNLPGKNSEEVPIEFLVDTGFEGELSLPSQWVERLDVQENIPRRIVLADGSLRRVACYEVFIDDEYEEQARRTEILVTEGTPLLGVLFLAEQALTIEFTIGGSVTSEPL